MVGLLNISEDGQREYLGFIQGQRESRSAAPTGQAGLPAERSQAGTQTGIRILFTLLRAQNEI